MDNTPRALRFKSPDRMDESELISRIFIPYGAKIAGYPELPKMAEKPEPELQGFEAAFSTKYPNLAATHFALGSVFLPYAARAAVWPSVKEEQKQLPGMAIAGIYAADVLGFTPGIGKGLSFGAKKIFKQFSKDIGTGLRAITGSAVFKNVQDDLLKHHFSVAKINKMFQKGTARKQAFREQWEKVIKKNPILNRFQQPNQIDQVAKVQLKRIFGDEGAKIKTGEIAPKVWKNMIIDADLHSTKILRAMDITNLAYIRPIRKVMESAESIFKLSSRGYEPTVKIFGKAKKLENNSIQEFWKILEQKGLVKLPKEVEPGRYKLGPPTVTRLFSQEVGTEAGDLLHQITEKVAQNRSQEVSALFKSASPDAQNLLKGYWEWADIRYGEQFNHDVNRMMKMLPTFRGLNPSKKPFILKEVEDALGVVQATLRASNNIDPLAKGKIINQMVGKIQKSLADNIDGERARKFFVSKMDFGSKGGSGILMGYRPYYGQSIPGKTQKTLGDFVTGIHSHNEASYLKPRTGVETRAGVERDIGRLVEARSSQQAKQIAVVPYLHPSSEFSTYMRTLPEGYRTYMTHFVARMLGRPSPTDVKIAKWVNKAFGSNMSGSQVDKVAQEVNNLLFMGILSKPFTAARNLFQPPLLFPGEMGSIFAIKDFAEGVKWAAKKENKEYLLKLGVVQEYAPELFAKMRALPAGKTFKIGKNEIPIPEYDTFRDTILYLFSKSDAMGRLMTGGATVKVFQRAMKKHVKDGVLPTSKIRTFMKETGMWGQSTHKKGIFRQHLADNNFKAAMDAHVINTVAETNFLYGKADAPLGIYVAGAPGKMGAVFQSWTINYAELMAKWATTGQLPEKTIAWLTASAGAYMVMEQLWGGRVAAESTFLGPLVNPNMPIVLQPVVHAMESAFMLEGKNNSLYKKVLSDSKNFIPLGALTSNIMKGYERGGAREAGASIFGLEKGKLLRGGVRSWREQQH